MSETTDVRIIELLRGNSLFNNLKDAELELLLSILERKEYSKNQQVFAIDQKARFFYLVESGSFILSLRGKKFKTFKAGDIFGEIAIINENVRTGTIRALEDSFLIAINGNKLFSEQFIPAPIALKIIRALAKKVTNYLRSREQISTRELIANGENDYVEFKASMRWNAQSKSKDKVIEHAILKTVCAFMNTKGGTLLIGVADNLDIIGIGQDRFENTDKILLHITKLIKERISPLHIEFVKFEIEHLEGKNILRIDCEAATVPAYLQEKHNVESFYVRTGPSTSLLKVSQIYDYIRRRFH